LLSGRWRSPTTSFDYRRLFDCLLPALRDGIDGELVTDVSDWKRDAWRRETLHLDRDVPQQRALILFGRTDMVLV